MAEFGWAYIAGGAIREAKGPTGSIMLKEGEKEITGSSNLIFNTGSNILVISGDVSASINISGSAFYGDGSNLTGLSSTLDQITDNGNTTTNTITIGGFTATGNSVVTGSLTVSGSLYANEFVTNVVSKNVVNISATGSTAFGDSADDTHTFTGAITGSKLNLTGLAAGTATTSSYLAIDSSNNVVLTSSSGGTGGTIGAAEDGSYADGLFADFLSTTPVGTAIDKFNEVLKILAPSPAPSLSRINYDNTTGSTVKLSFGVGNALSDYTSSNTAAGFTAVSVSQSYAAATSGSNFRLGAYKNTTDITGFLNYTVVQSAQNTYVAYSDDAFGNAETGNLKLEVNGNTVHTVDLSSFSGTGNPATGSGNSVNGNASGFTNISVSASSFDGNNSEWHIFKHRTAKYKVDVNDMIPGWNYARVVHTIGATNYATNYVEWINDPSGSTNDLSISNPRIENISLVGSKYLSGVQYNTDVTANYKADINNLYRNVYAASGTPITFTVSNSAAPSAQAVPDINTGAGETHTKILGVTASLDCNQSSLISGSITANSTVTHPFKSTISNAGSATTGNGFLIDNRTLASSNLDEKFHDETYRITSGSYNTTASVTAGAATWNSQTHMTGSNVDGHQDGLLLYNQRLYSPVDGDITNGGNFSGISNVSSGQPNYSSTSGTRTFYRKIQNTSGATKYDIKLITTKNSTTFNNSSLGTGNLHFFVKIPETTGWMDITQNFVYGSISDGNGALINGASNDVDSGNNTHYLTFGTASVAANKYITIKIVGDASWAGYVERLQFTMGASSETPASAPALDDIDLDASGVDAKLSFGSSNAVVGFANTQGSGTGSMSTVNSNGVYSLSGDRRAIFTSLSNLNGTLNEDVGAHSNYSADSFFNGYSGSLALEVNGTTVHTTNIGSTLNALSNNYNGNNSGFSLSAVSFSTTTDDVPSYVKPFRTGTFQVGSADQRVGWNYARVIHGSTTTNYVEWVIDTSGAVDNTAVTTPVLSDFNHNDIYYQSGIKYFASRPSASFAYTGSNFYSNVYSNANDAISFGTTTNCSVSNIRAAGAGLTTFDSGVSQASMPALNNNADCEITTIQVTGTILFDSLTSISGGLGLFTKRDVSVASTLKHPFKTNKTTSTATKTAFMVYSGSVGSTNLGTQEYFNTEDYRIVSGNYANQAAVTDAGNVWNSQTPLNGDNVHDDGMVTVNGFAISPFQIGKAGDTRNNSQGSTGLQAPSGNPNYSTLTNSTRTYYRYFRYTDASTVASFTVTLHGDATLVGKTGTYAAALGANKNVFVEVKIPYDPNYSGADDQSTGWADAAKIFDASNQPNNDGAGIRAGSFSGEDQTIDSGGLALSLTLGTRRIKQNQYVIVKVSAHKDWTGYLSRIQVAY